MSDQRTCRSCDHYAREARTRAGLQVDCDHEHKRLPIRRATECQHYQYAPGVDEPWDEDDTDIEGMI